jgi:signal transduction histidine kinase
MERKIDAPGKKLKLFRNQTPQGLGTHTNQHSQRLRDFLQLQIDLLVTHAQIQWVEVIYYNPQIPNQRQSVEASQTSFPCSDETRIYLESEQWLSHNQFSLTLQPIGEQGIEAGFYACHLSGQNQPGQYLLLFVERPLSHTCRQSIKRISACIHDYLDISQQNYQQQQQIESLEDIVQRVGHQLRHPLGLVSLYAHNLKQTLPEGKEQEQAAVICQTTRSLNQSLNEIMQCGSSQKLQITLQDLRSLVLKTIDEFQGWIAEKDLQINYSDRVLMLKLDPLQIKQVLNNLLSNAIHFSPKGRAIFIDWREAQGNALLSVTDEGPGLSSEDLPKLFKPFYTRRAGGTGLGLSIAQKVVLDHGGKLWARNAPGKGAEFSMSLPRCFSSIHHLAEDNTAC